MVIQYIPRRFSIVIASYSMHHFSHLESFPWFRFGPGPHHVRIEIDFNPEEIPDGTATSFTIEMAPIEFVSARI